MKLHRFFIATAGLMVSSCLTTSSYAFMADAATSPSNENADIVAVTSRLSEELAAGETSCEAMLEKLDDALATIDAGLDAGVTDELAYLRSRERIVEMRLSLPCLGDQLAGEMIGEPLHGEVISDVVVGEQIVGGEIHGHHLDEHGGPIFGGGGTMGGGSFATGGGGGGAGGGLGGGGGLGLLAAGGIAAAIAIPLAVDDDDEPGVVVSVSAP